MRHVVLRAGGVEPSVALNHGEFVSWIRRELESESPGEWLEHDLQSNELLPIPRVGDVFFMTGSPSSVTERAPWMLRAEAFVRKLAQAQMPLFGICFGHQLIAQALGGRVAQNPRGREIGTLPVRIGNDGPRDFIFQGIPNSFFANHTHVDSAVELPLTAHVRVLATTEREPHAACSFGPTIKTVQFHPEMNGDAMRGYIKARESLIDAEGGDARGTLARVTDTPESAEILRNFVRAFTKR